MMSVFVSYVLTLRNQIPSKYASTAFCPTSLPPHPNQQVDALACFMFEKILAETQSSFLFTSHLSS